MERATANAQHHGLWQAAAWYRALTLAERLGSRQAAGTDGASPPDLEHAQARLRSWKSQRPFERQPLFAQRLAVDSLSDSDLLALLAEGADSVKARTPVVPDWLAALKDAFSRADTAEDPCTLLAQIDTDHPHAACLPALGPLLQRGLRAVESRVQQLRDEYGFVPVDVEALPARFLTNIVPAILFGVSKPVILELHIARLRGALTGETPEARFEQFMRQLTEDGRMTSLLAKYPVLARHLVVAIDQWADYLSEFLTHLCADWHAIRRTFAGDSDPGLLVEIDAGRGDPHRRGRTVLVLRFAGGMQLVYKPKPIAVDRHFQELLSWLNDRGADPPLRPLTLLDRGDYGWSEFVTASSCASEEEVTRFFERHGSYLALLYALNGTDLHNENLIAAGEHPMLVDLETLFHPRVYGQDPVLSANLAATALVESVWQVGILPQRVWSDEDSLGVDTSGLGGASGQVNPHPIVTWDDTGSDRIRASRRHVELPASDNRARLDDAEVDVLAYKDAIVAGFRRMYRLLCRHRDAVLAEQLPRFADDEVRVLVRPTNVYGLLLYEGFHPDVLRDALDRDRLFDRLWGEAAHRPYLARVIPAEQRDLWRGDIPVFTTTPGSTAMVTSDGEVLVDFCDAPGLDLVRRRMERLDEEDLVKQTWIINASLATLVMHAEGPIDLQPALPPISGPVHREQMLALADGIGRRLDELALQDDTSAGWLGVGPLDNDTWALVPSGVDLYAGTSGIALFLAYLGAVTGAPAHTLLAKRALTALRPQVHALLKIVEEEEAPVVSRPSPGAFDGLASVIYLLTHLAVLWSDADLLREAEGIVERVPPLIAKDERLDIIYGSAGCILCLLALYTVSPSARTLDVAVQCGERLLATAQRMPAGTTAWTTFPGEPPLGGFSHGASGIAFSLLQLATRTGDDRFREAAVGGLAYDRSLFVPEHNNWADLRVFRGRAYDPGGVTDPATESARNLMVAWCHGAAGIGLGRLAGIPHLDDEQVRAEIDTAVATTRDAGFAMNHSLCHGALGNIDTLLLAAQVLHRPGDHDALEAAIAAVVGSIEAHGPITGVPFGMETPGLMTGLAGIGYQLLRLAAPDRVPSVLLLAPPVEQTQA